MESLPLFYTTKSPSEITSTTSLLILLHGYGSNEEDLLAFSDSLDENFLVVSLRGPLVLDTVSYAWFDINFLDQSPSINTQQGIDSLNDILNTIVQIKNHYGLNNQKVHLCGFSQGGMLCYALALRNPNLFGKVACLSAYPEESLLQLGSISKKELEHLRFFISHGTEDGIIPIEWARKAADLLYDLGCYFSFREYMSGHAINPKNYKDLMDFINS